MRKIILYIATSLNGYIAKADGSVDWLENIPNPHNEDYGYSDFLDSIDITIQGNSTYKQIIGWGIEFPYKNTTNYVITSSSKLKDDEYVNFISENHIESIRKLKSQKGKDIWLIGGGKVNSFLLNNGLIDEIHQFIMPIVIEDGIKLFDSIKKDINIKIIDIKNYNSSVIRYRYKVE